MVSIIISTHNQTHILPWLLKSLENQDYRGAFEVLVCDDGSTQNTFRVATRFENRGKLDMKFLWQPRDGIRLARTRNNGIRSARGDILIFLDGDCVVPPAWLSGHVKSHRKGAHIVGGTRAWVDPKIAKSPQIKSLSHLYRMSERHRFYPDKERQKQLFRGRLPWTGCWGFNVSVTKSPEVYFDEKLGWGHEDCELFCRLANKANYSALLKTELEVFHFSAVNAKSPQNPWSTKDSEVIGRYLQNLLYVTNKHSGLDIKEAMWPIHYFQLDLKAMTWRKLKSGETMSIEKGLALIEHWEAHQRQRKPTPTIS